MWAMSINILTFKYGRTRRSCCFHAKPSRPYLKESFNVEDADIVRIVQYNKFKNSHQYKEIAKQHHSYVSLLPPNIWKPTPPSISECR